MGISRKAFGPIRRRNCRAGPARIRDYTEVGVLPGGRFGETSARHPFHACNFRRPNGSVGAGSMDPTTGTAGAMERGSAHPREICRGCSLLLPLDSVEPEALLVTEYARRCSHGICLQKMGY